MGVWGPYSQKIFLKINAEIAYFHAFFAQWRPVASLPIPGGRSLRPVKMGDQRRPMGVKARLKVFKWVHFVARDVKVP